MSILVNYIFLLLLLLIITGCKEIEQKSQVPQKVTTIVKKDEDLERWKEVVKKEAYIIDIKQLQNPFISPKTYKFLSKKEETIALELVGIVIKGNKKYALLQDATKKGYIVKVGDKLGNLTIKEISADNIIIEEVEENIFGGIEKRLRKINLKKG
ncbi:MAG: pilus assembly protein PilP, partial [Patescibacteria group bacterium]